MRTTTSVRLPVSDNSGLALTTPVSRSSWRAPTLTPHSGSSLCLSATSPDFTVWLGAERESALRSTAVESVIGTLASAPRWVTASPGESWPGAE